MEKFDKSKRVGKVLKWKLVKEYTHQNLWKTTNLFEEVDGKIVDKNYKESFHKNIDPNISENYRCSERLYIISNYGD